MKRLDLDPTKGNISNSIENDIFGRNHHLKRFYEMLNSSEDIRTFSIDGEWGSGKTFFVKELCTLINSYNSSVEQKEQNNKTVKSIIKIEKPDTSMYAVYYDAWKNDNDIDPILSLLFEIAEQLEVDFSLPELNLNSKKIIKEIVKLIFPKNIIISEMINCLDNIQEKDLFDEFKQSRQLENKIQEFFSVLPEKKCNKLVIFIDELDRCKPNYAVKLLERIKHYFINFPKIKFVFSLNSRELQHSVKKIYGNEFDAYQYLDRFFDIRLNLPEIKIDEMWNALGINSSVSDSVLKTVIQHYSMSYREAAHYKSICKIIQNKYSSGKMEHIPFDAENRLLNLYITPIVIGTFLMNRSDYDSLISGNNNQLFNKILLNIEHFGDIWRSLCNENEEINIQDVDIKKQVAEKLYDSIFNFPNDAFCTSIKVGNYGFTKRSKEILLEMTSLLSDLSDYGNGE